MKRLLLHLFATFGLLTMAPEPHASAQSLPTEALAAIDYEQKLGAQVPLDLSFRDETGAPLVLGSLLGRKPAILVLAYYECPNLCTLVLNGLLESVRDLHLDAGRDFEIIVVSIRPDESTNLAEAKKRAYTRRYARPGTAQGWHFLTGDAEPIAKLAESVGFHSRLEPESRQYAHASGIVILTPEGTVSRYFLGIEYPPKEVRLALVEASQNKVGTLADRLILLCFHYNPATGRYGLAINRSLQVAGIGTVLLLGLMVYRLGQRARPRTIHPA